MSRLAIKLAASKTTALKNLNALVRDLPPRLAKLEEDSASHATFGDVDLFDRLERFYKSVDEVLTFALRYTPCKRGCCGCCYYRIEVFGIEAAYLERTLGIRIDPLGQSIEATHGLPCPFLSKNECTIYRYRPYACRKYMTLDTSSYWCQPNRASTTELPLARFTKFDETMRMLAVESGVLEPKDIRNIFPFGLCRKGVKTAKL